MNLTERVRAIGPGRLLGLLIVLLVLAVGGYAIAFWTTGGDPVSPRAPYTLFQIHQGEPLDIIAARLQERGVIRNPLFFRLYADVSHSAADVQAGTYLVSGRETAAALLQEFVEGKVATRKLTVPEGFTVSDIAFRLQAEHFASAQTFVAVARDFANPFLKMGADVRYRLEGYAFPTTYELPYGASAREIADIMFAELQRQFTPAMRTLAAQEDLTPNQVLTLASIVEKEAPNNQQRAKIAAVFLNRLKKGMKLQSDPTISYAMGRHLTYVSLADEKYPSPYNTYYVTGLPPGPICNPGLPSIEAVLHPADVTYLFFYSLPNGSVIYSNTYNQQLAAERAHP